MAYQRPLFINGVNAKEASELKKVKQLEEENSKLKRIYTDLALELDMAKYIIEKKL